MIGFRVIAAAAFVILSACSSDPTRQSLLKMTMHRQDVPQPDPTFMALAERGAPAFVLSVEQREQAFSLLVYQGENTNGQETWVTGDGLSVGMKKGVILATRGFGGDMIVSDPAGLLPLVISGTEGISELFISHLNANDEIAILAFRCLVISDGNRDIDLGGYVAKTQLMRAQCRNADTHFDNLYWVEHGSRQIVQSRQWISNHLGTLALRLVPGGT